METAPHAGLTLGPLLFNWPAEVWRDFYARIADEASVDRVCLGEVVCSKRWPFVAEHLGEAVERLQRGGKRVVLCSLAMPTLPRERAMAADLIALPDVDVEVNDISVLPRIAGRPHAIGPFVNVYNEATLAVLARGGATRACLPPELPLGSIRAIAASAGDVAIEVFAFGRVPLAVSARCYHARVHGLSKDSCQFVCEKDPDGLVVDTLDGERFLAINGIQTLSDTCASLLPDLAALRAAGVSSFRLSPHTCDMVAVAQTFRDALDGRIDPEEATERLAGLVPFAAFSNGFVHGEPGWKRIAAG